MEIKKIYCPLCGKELIKLEPYDDNKAEFWCDDCNIEIVITKDNERRN